MTQWEQIKKEYRELPIPSEGPHQVLQAMAQAKRKRNRLKQLTHYATVAAALLLILLVPGTLLFSGVGGASKEDSAYVESDSVMESTSAGRGWFANQSAKDNAAPATSDGVPTAAPEYGLNDEKADEFFSAEAVEAISKEIILQMEERMQEKGETYYIRSSAYPDGFEYISNDQTFYVNENGLVVIVFPAGTVAPKEQGEAEFIIPAEVIAP